MSSCKLTVATAETIFLNPKEVDFLKKNQSSESAHARGGSKKFSRHFLLAGRPGRPCKKFLPHPVKKFYPPCKKILPGKKILQGKMPYFKRS